VHAWRIPYRVVAVGGVAALRERCLDELEAPTLKVDTNFFDRRSTRCPGEHL
jgi:hypothetical protein